MLKGQAKTDYQRAYMRRYRSNRAGADVRPMVRPVLDLPMSMHKRFVGELSKDRQTSTHGFNG